MRIFPRSIGCRFRILPLLFSLSLLASTRGYASGLPPVVCEIKPHAGRVGLFLNGQPTAPVLYSLTDCPGGRNTWEEYPARNLQQFTKAGFSLYQISIWFRDIWKQEGTLDLAHVQRQLRGVLEANPQAAVFLRLHLNAPFWWLEQHPEELTAYADRPAEPMPAYWTHVRHTTMKDLGPTALHSLASQKWREDTTVQLQRFCAGLAATEEGKRVAGLHLCDGVSHEWHYWGFIDHDPDTGPAMTRYFREWLRLKYKTEEALQAAWQNPKVTFASAEVPGLAVRDFTSEGLFRDPQRERYVIDYYEAQHEVVAEDLLHFCKVAKTSWPRPVATGAFYGYFFMMFSRQAVGGHLAMEKVLASPFIDYLSAPQIILGGGAQPRGRRPVPGGARFTAAAWQTRPRGDGPENPFRQPAGNILGDPSYRGPAPGAGGPGGPAPQHAAAALRRCRSVVLRLWLRRTQRLVGHARVPGRDQGLPGNRKVLSAPAPQTGGRGAGDL